MQRIVIGRNIREDGNETEKACTTNAAGRSQMGDCFLLLR